MPITTPYLSLVEPDVGDVNWGDLVNSSNWDKLDAWASSVGQSFGSLSNERVISLNSSTGPIVIVGGNNITLSQNLSTITINGASQSIQTQNLVDVSLSGNTVGVMALISSGTMTLAGGNNITLSQAGNAITISGAILAQVGISGGNTSGDTGTKSGRILFAGGNNITLSGSTNANSMSVTISAANQTEQTQNLIDVSFSGNTAGVLALISSGTMILAGGNNITLSQNGQSLTISGGNFSAGISGGNTSGDTGTKQGRIVFAGGNNITLSGSTNGNSMTVTVSAGAGGGGINASLAGNSTSAGAGFILVSSGTLTLAGGNNVTLSQDGNAVTISAGVLSAGISTLGNTAGDTGAVRGRFILVGGNNVTLSGSTNGISMSLTVSAFNQSNQSIGIYGSSQTTGQSSSSSVDARSLTVVGQGIISVGMSGGSLLISGAAGGQTNQTIGVYASSQTTGQSSSSTVDARSFTHVGQGIISVGMSAGSLLISATTVAQSVQTQNLFDLTIGGNSTSAGAGYQLISSGTGLLAGGNNITLSQNGQSITISAFNQTVQTQHLIDVTLGGNSTSAGAGYILMSSGTMTLAGGNNITLSQNGNAVTISAANTVAQTNQTIGVYGSSQTVGQSSSSTVDARSFTHVGQGIVSVGMSAGSLLISATTVAQTVQTQNLIDVTLAGNSTSAGAGYILLSSGTMTLAGGNNITLSQNGNAVTISAFTQTVQTQNLCDITIGGNSTSAGAGYQLISSGTAFLAGGNNITLSQNGQSITVSGPNTVAQTNQTIGVYASSQTVGQSSSSTVDARSFTHVGQGIISVGMSAGSLLISATQSVQTQNLIDVTLGGNSTSAGAGYQLISSGTMFLAGGNNVTLSQNGQSVTISAFTQTVQTQNLFDLTIGGNSTSAGAGYQLISSGTGLLAGGNNITLSQNGQSITISGAAQGTLNFNAGNNASLSSNAAGGVTTITISANAAAFSIGGNSTSAGGGYSNISSGTAVLLGGNNITLSQDGRSITISAFNQSVQTVGIYGSSQTTGQSSSSTVDARSITFVGQGAASVGMSGGSVLISVALGGQTNQTIGVYASSQTVGQSSSSTIDARSFTHVGQGMISVGMSAGSLLISATQSVQTQNLFDLTIGGNSTSAGGGYQLISSGTGLLAGGNNITLSQNGQSITISAGKFQAGMSNIGNTTGTTAMVSDQLVLAGGNGITLSGSTNAGSMTISISAQEGTLSYFEPIQIAGQSLTSKQLGNGTLGFYHLQPQCFITATRMLQLISFSISSSSNSSHAGVLSYRAGIYTLNGSSLSLITDSSGSQTYQWTNTSSNSLSALSGMKGITIPININMSPGDYWIGLLSQTSSTNANWFTISNMVALVNQQSYGGLLLGGGNNTVGPSEVQGILSVSTAALPASVGLSQLSQAQIASLAIPYMAFKLSTF